MIGYGMSTKREKLTTGMSITNLDGGEGSGNWGHEGRPGEVGGSGPGGGVANRWTNKQGQFTSFAKQRAKAAKPHVANHKELTAAPVGTKLIGTGKMLTKVSETKWQDTDGNIYGSHSLKTGLLSGKECKMAIPKTSESSEKVFEKLGAIGSYDSGLMSDDFGGTKGVKAFKVSKENAKKLGKNENIKSVYSSEQVSKAVKYQNTSEALNAYKADTEKVWSELNQDEKSALYNYTAGSKHINEPLQGKLYLGGKNTGKTLQEIKDISHAIDKSSIPEDTIMYHGLGNGGFKSIMGISDLSEDSLNSIIGKVGFDNSFCSCGAAKGTGFTSKPVQMEIFVPKGSKGLFSDQFSAYGNGVGHWNDGSKWNGKTEYSSASSECEVILQKGNSYKVTGYKQSYGKLIVQCELVGQSDADWMPEGVETKTGTVY